jgi:hypothetical protein
MIQNCGLNDAYRASEARGAATLTIEALQSLRECGLSFYRQQREQFFAEAGSALTPEAK